MTWRGDKIVDLSRAFLNTNGVTQRASAVIAPPDETKNYRRAVPQCLSGMDRARAFKEILAGSRSARRLAFPSGLTRASARRLS